MSKHLVHMRYQFPPGAKDGQGNALETLVVRELNSYDLLTASKIADANRTDGSQERVAAAIVRVNEENFVVGDIGGWNQIAIEFALMAYLRISSTRSDVVEDRLSKGEVVPA